MNKSIKSLLALAAFLWHVRRSPASRALLALRQWPHTRSVYPFGEVSHYTDARADVPSDQLARDLVAFLTGRGFTHATVERTAPTVEDSFMARMAAAEGHVV